MKSASKNMVMSVVSRLISLVTGLIVQRYLLLAFGSTLNGLTTSINQVMAYLVLLEAGLGTASVQALYDPLAVGNWKKVSGILTATGIEYKKISAIFFTLLLGVSVLIPLAVSGEVEFATAGLLTIITGSSYVISYIMGGKYKALLDADRKIYVLYALDSISVIASCVLRVIALNAGQSIVLVQLLNLACTAIKNAGYVIYVRVKYNKVNYRYPPDIAAIGKRWNVLIHSIAGIVVNNTDVIILTLFGTLKVVSVYGIYNMVFGQLSSIVQTTFMQAPQSSFGRLVHSDRNKFEDAFELYEFILSFILFVICSIALVMILPFVSLYTNGVDDVSYVDKKLPVLLTLILLMNQIRIPSLITINVAGHFKETQAGAIIEAIINIVLSIIFVIKFGIIGVAIATFMAMTYRTIAHIFYLKDNILHRSIGKSLKNMIIFLISAIIIVILSKLCFIIEKITILNWIIYAIKNTVLAIVVFAVALGIFYRKQISKVFKKVKEKN